MSDEQKTPTATKLFTAYMKSVDKVRALIKALATETTTAENLAAQLSAQYGIYVTGNQPAAKRPRQPITAPSDKGAGAATRVIGEETPGGEDFELPPQHHSSAPELASAGSAEVADIRRDAGLDVQAEDEQLASEGLSMMEQLQRGMKGVPSVVAIPGEHQQDAAEGRSNAEGGPVTQKPTEE